MYVEIVYETGRSSIADYADEAEALSALQAHQDRAMAGESGGPAGAPFIPAERIKRVFVYDKHPNEYNAAQTMSSDVLSSELADLVKKMSDDNDVVNVDSLAAEVRGLTHPMVTDSGPHESNFKMEAKSEITLPWEKGAENA